MLFIGDKANHWKGGRRINTQGYVLIYRPDHPHHDSHGYVREHRIIIENNIHRILNRKEVVHHINGIKHDNRPHNLMLLKSNSDNTSLYFSNMRNDIMKRKCAVCKNNKTLYVKSDDRYIWFCMGNEFLCYNCYHKFYRHSKR